MLLAPGADFRGRLRLLGNPSEWQQVPNASIYPRRLLLYQRDRVALEPHALDQASLRHQRVSLQGGAQRSGKGSPLMVLSQLVHEVQIRLHVDYWS